MMRSSVDLPHPDGPISGRLAGQEFAIADVERYSSQNECLAVALDDALQRDV